MRSVFHATLNVIPVYINTEPQQWVVVLHRVLSLSQIAGGINLLDGECMVNDGLVVGDEWIHSVMDDGQ